MKYIVGDKVNIIKHDQLVVNDYTLESIIYNKTIVTICDFSENRNDYEIEGLKGFWFRGRSLKLVKRVEPQISILLSNPQERFELLDL